CWAHEYARALARPVTVTSTGVVPSAIAGANLRPQNVVMQASRCGREPRSEAMFCPVCRSEQNNAGTLHEERAQIAVAALRNATQVRAITGRHLLRHQAEPRGEVSPCRKGGAIADCRHHCAGDDRADARNRHQLPATLIASCQHLDLSCYVIDTFIETPPF